MINAIGTIALVFVTMALVLVTGYYAITTNKMFREMEIGRKRSFVPLINIELPSSSSTIYIPSEIILKNLGNAPALKAQFNVGIKVDKKFYYKSDFYYIGGVGTEKTTIDTNKLTPNVPLDQDIAAAVLLGKDIKNIDDAVVNCKDDTKQTDNEEKWEKGIVIEVKGENCYGVPFSGNYQFTKVKTEWKLEKSECKCDGDMI